MHCLWMEQFLKFANGAIPPSLKKNNRPQLAWAVPGRRTHIVIVWLHHAINAWFNYA